jgi:predicted RNase H-like HicB family nuclease
LEEYKEKNLVSWRLCGKEQNKKHFCGRQGMDFFTVVFKKSNGYMLALCLENGITAQGDSKEEALKKLQEGIESVEEAIKEDEEIYNAPVPIKELHEFLTMESREIVSEQFELMAIHA